MSRRLSRRFRWPGAPRCAPTVVPIGSARVLSEKPPQRGQHVPRRGQRRTGLARRACRAAECVQRNRSTTALGQTISGDPAAGELAARAGARRSPLSCQTLGGRMATCLNCLQPEVHGSAWQPRAHASVCSTSHAANIDRTLARSSSSIRRAFGHNVWRRLGLSIKVASSSSSLRPVPLRTQPASGGALKHRPPPGTRSAT
jgi:hypothetical protein